MYVKVNACLHEERVANRAKNQELADQRKKRMIERAIERNQL